MVDMPRLNNRHKLINVLLLIRQHELAGVLMPIGMNGVTGAEAPVADLPSTPIVKPDDFPDWGDAYVAPTKPECAAVASPDVRYAVTTA